MIIPALCTVHGVQLHISVLLYTYLMMIHVFITPSCTVTMIDGTCIHCVTVKMLDQFSSVVLGVVVYGIVQNPDNKN